jgi:hypothetical protein
VRVSPRRRGGLTHGHANRGKGWESVCDGWHDLYARRGDRVWIIPTSAKVKQLSRMGRVSREGSRVVVDTRTGGNVFAACYAAGGPPDYAGIALGVGFAFDAKQSLTSDRFAFSLLKDHQAGHLDSAVRAGGYSWLLVQLRLRSYLFWWDRLAPHWWRWKRAGGRPASLKPDDPGEGMEGIAVRLPSDGWLPLLRERIAEDQAPETTARRNRTRRSPPTPSE